MTKYFLVTLALVSITIAAWGQEEDLLINQVYKTTGTGSLYKNQWTKIAECSVYGNYQDSGAAIEFFANGSGSWKFYYGKIIIRLKNQSASLQPFNYYNLTLVNSNLGSENLKIVRNGLTAELFVRIPESYTVLVFRQIIKGVSKELTLLSYQPFLENLPSGDLIIDCEENQKLPNNSIVDKLHIGYQVATANTLGEVTRLSLEPYGHTGGNWDFICRDIQGAAFLDLRYNNTLGITIKHNGNMGIGTSNPKEKLSVDGTILAKEVKVSTDASDWPDFVFEDNYQLRDLSEIETFIKTNKHFPDIPSASEMETEGVNLAEMNKLLLQKIEELTLYIIDLNKENEELKSEVAKQQEIVNENKKEHANTQLELDRRLKRLESLLVEKSL